MILLLGRGRGLVCGLETILFHKIQMDRFEQLQPSLLNCHHRKAVGLILMFQRIFSLPGSILQKIEMIGKPFPVPLPGKGEEIFRTGKNGLSKTGFPLITD